MLWICEAMKAWLSLDPENVLLLSCKNGKTKTGIVVACFQMYMGFADNPSDAFTHFFNSRTSTTKTTKKVMRSFPRDELRYLNSFHTLAALETSGLVHPSPATTRSWSKRRKLEHCSVEHCTSMQHEFGGYWPVTLARSNATGQAHYPRSDSESEEDSDLLPAGE
jgi:hypothetical protein